MPMILYRKVGDINFAPNHTSGICKARLFKFRVLIDEREYTSACVIYYPQKGCVQSHVTSLNFGK